MASKSKFPQLLSYDEIYSFYTTWNVVPPPDKGWTQKRGYAFEHILASLFELEQLNPRSNYRPDGEEIDGSFVFGGRIYLFEAKWWKRPLAASQLYAFKGKVDGKLSGTIGVFISHSGFAEDAVAALVAGKGINMVLFNDADLEAILKQQFSFTDAIVQKLRHATEYGQPFLPLTSTHAESNSGHGSANESDISIIDVVVEGPSDEAGLKTLVEVHSENRNVDLRLWPATNRKNLLPLSESLLDQGSSDVSVFLDQDQMSVTEVGELSDHAKRLGVELLIFQPSFISVLEDACDVNFYNAYPPTGVATKHARRMARHSDLDRLWNTNPDFYNWWTEKIGN